MEFEYDRNKSYSNKEKHGIDFEEAQTLWVDSKRVEVSARTVGEERKVLIAELNSEIWSAIFSVREKNIRIISVRKARKNEKEIYYNTGI